MVIKRTWKSRESFCVSPGLTDRMQPASRTPDWLSPSPSGLGGGRWEYLALGSARLALKGMWRRAVDGSELEQQMDLATCNNNNKSSLKKCFNLNCEFPVVEVNLVSHQRGSCSPRRGSPVDNTITCPHIPFSPFLPTLTSHDSASLASLMFVSNKLASPTYLCAFFREFALHTHSVGQLTCSRRLELVWIRCLVSFLYQYHRGKGLFIRCTNV